MSSRAFRTEETNKKYNEFRASGGLSGSCVLCGAEPIKLFGHWKIVENRFPYDRIAKTHHIAVLKRHITEDEITDEEHRELRILKREYIDTNYDAVLNGTSKTMTVPEHYHFHLIVTK